MKTYSPLTNNNPYWYHFLAIITVIIWGTTFISTKILLNHGLTPTEILLYRFSLAYIGIWLFKPRKLFADNIKDELLLVLAGGCGGTLYFVTENTALQITLASNVSLILCTAPILTAFISRLINRETLKKNLLYGSFFAFLGVSMVVFNGGFILKINPLGDILTLIAALMWAFYGMILKNMGNRYPTLFITRKVFFYGVVLLIPFLWVKPIYPDTSVLIQPMVWINLLFLGLLASLLCYLMWNTAVKNLGVVRTTNYIYLVPMVTLITSYLVINETITWLAIIGSVFILSGVYIAEKGLPAISKLTGQRS
ncbi:MAG: DMT family transporter [Tannerellaceae bacterium]|nr:DMT family transporter [Tannerellaceae bacterium]